MRYAWRECASLKDETTATLLARVRAGDRGANDALVRRYLPALRRWAHGRLPPWARDLADTDDLVQVTLLRALRQVEAFEPRRSGSFLAYLRSILRNEIRDHIRRVAKRPLTAPLTHARADEEDSPLARVIGAERLEAYERALSQLSAEQQEAILMRIELGYSWDDVAQATGSPSADAARMAVTRALGRLAETMDG